MALSPKPQTFLARASYRQRRLRDAARVLPIFGALLFMAPLLWPRDGATEGANGTSEATLYLFGVWALLIVASFILVRVIKISDDPESLPPTDPTDSSGPPGGR